MALFAQLVLGWSVVVSCVELEAVRRALFPRAAPAPSEAPRAARVLVIRPCAGSEPWLSNTLPSLACARRSFSASCRVALADEDDTALAAARDAVAALAAAGLDASVVFTAPRGPNRKAAQLAAVIAAERAPFDVVLVADGDVDLDGADLDALIAPLVGASARASATWAPPVETAPARTLGDRASAAVLGGSLQAFPVLAGLDRAGLVGKLFAVERVALEEAGGFGALVSHLGEDMELARRLRAARRRVEAAPIVARSMATGRSWAEVERRFARWIMVIRAQRPALLPSYPLLFLATAPVVVASAVATAAAPLCALASASLATVLRLAIAATAARAAGRSLAPAELLKDVVLGDALLALAFVRALRSRRVVWRDVALTIDGAGELRLADEA